MWRGYLREWQKKQRSNLFIFDAFENDYQKDPFLTLASEIYQLITVEDDTTQTKFKDKAAKAAKSLVRGALKVFCQK